ncbi:hypothetical protein ACFQT0_19655 [Hymenobacter humi]|uniref:Uncharacterized protein n=1 Tax=Hymenobacter humi TaxID=1411620 RepID=A0ABW2UAS4_9BACT
MLVDGVLILYTSDPTSGPMRTLVAQMQAQGREVFLKPLTQARGQKESPRDARPARVAGPAFPQLIFPLTLLNVQTMSTKSKTKLLGRLLRSCRKWPVARPTSSA